MRPGGDRGSVLLASLWVVVAAAVVAGAMIAVARPAQTVARHEADNLRWSLQMQAGVVLGIEGLLGQVETWRTDGSIRDLMAVGIPLRAVAEDEAGKIDLNFATDDLLRQAMTAVSRDVDRLADAIRDWRDADSERRLQGAETRDYAAVGRTYGPSNRPFQSVAELQRVLGISPQTYLKLAPLTTVYTQRAGVDSRLASAAVLALLPGMDAPTIQALLAERRAAPPESRGVGRTVTLLVADRTASPAAWMAVIRLSGAASRPFDVLLWQKADERLLRAS